MNKQGFTITKSELKTTIKIRKKYDWKVYAFLLFVFGFIFGLLYLLGIAKEQLDGEPGSFYVIFPVILVGIGGVLFLAMIYETLKRESIESDKYYLTLINKVLGFPFSSRKYDRTRIRHLQLAPLPEKGWKQTDAYSDKWHSGRTYTYGSGSANPTLQFEYKGEGYKMVSEFLGTLSKAEYGQRNTNASDEVQTVTFAWGLSPAEAQQLLEILLSK